MTQSTYKVADSFTQLRNMVLSLTAEQLGLTESSAFPILAVVMETGYESAVASLVTVADGSASLYFSNGGGMIGSGHHDGVRDQAATLFIQASQTIEQFTAPPSCPLPELGATVFYLVTRGGIVSAGATNKELESDSHPLTALFAQGHNVISAIRVAQDQSS